MITSFIIMSISSVKSKIPFLALFGFLLFYILYQEKSHDAALLLVKESIKSVFLKKANQGIGEDSKKHHIALLKNNNNIILVIGESMRSRENLKDRYDIFENYNYKTIISGATNTDVAVPLLLNGGISPQKIDLEQNIFLLAKKNGYKTSFISAQNEKSLQYIEPYLHKEYIDNFHILGSRDDRDLIGDLQKISLEESNLIVLQMQGEHSPYMYYENANRDDAITLRYHKSMLYSNEVLKKLITYIDGNSKKPFLFLFVSDHGELLGEDGKTGHNRFEKEIYSVPLFIHSNIEINSEKLKNHSDIYRLIYHHLGYSKEFEEIKRDKIRVYGTMITEEDGYIDIDM